MVSQARCFPVWVDDSVGRNTWDASTAPRVGFTDDLRWCGLDFFIRILIFLSLRAWMAKRQPFDLLPLLAGKQGQLMDFVNVGYLRL